MGPMAGFGDFRVGLRIEFAVPWTAYARNHPLHFLILARGPESRIMLCL